MNIHSKYPSIKLITITVLLIGSGCAKQVVIPPDEVITSRNKITKISVGGWLSINDNSRVGELIAVHQDSILILLNNHDLEAISKEEVINGILAIHFNNHHALSAWTFLGSISALSHGLLKVITIPAWIIIGFLDSLRESQNVNYLLFPESNWKEISKFARFPQGLPSGINRKSITKAKIVYQSN